MHPMPYKRNTLVPGQITAYKAMAIVGAHRKYRVVSSSVCVRLRVTQAQDMTQDGDRTHKSRGGGWQ